MYDRQNPIFWAWTAGRVWGTDVRLSWLLPAFGLVFVVLCGWQLGLAYFTILMLSVLAHEFGHVFAARVSGGQADEIILTPVGGLAMAQPGPGVGAAVLTAAGGLIVNLLLCLVFCPEIYAPDKFPAALNLAYLPIDRLHPETLAVDLLLLAFVANWFLLAINLLPVFPFDGGQIAHAVLSSKYPPEIVFRGMIYLGFAAAVGLMLGGLLAQWAGLVVIGAIVLAVNVLQSTQGPPPEFADDSFMGYDFSQGYTSLERSSGRATESEPKTSSWQRWKLRRQAKREEQARERQLQDEMQLDQLLAKVHEQGYNSLTGAEKRLLERVSSDYRERSKRNST
jgi:stage IV sporulation protein FB